jgi:hypothetical protein
MTDSNGLSPLRVDTTLFETWTGLASRRVPDLEVAATGSEVGVGRRRGPVRSGASPYLAAASGAIPVARTRCSAVSAGEGDYSANSPQEFMAGTAAVTPTPALVARNLG